MAQGQINQCIATTAFMTRQPPSSSLLRITELFVSLQGEAEQMGWPTAFIRLTGCPLRCQYCDTAYAFHGGTLMELSHIIETVKTERVRYVCVTGGEPLAQKNCLALLKQLCNAGFHVSLETSGALAIDAVDPRVSRVVDLKTPGSGEVDRNLWQNLAVLNPHDQLKCVICNEDDYHWAHHLVLDKQLHRRCSVWFSPSHGQIAPTLLADWIVRDRLPVRFQLQLHKLLWNDGPGR